ncbi:MAG: glycosyl hydrolase family 18 protein [Bacteroidota bacterium]
MRSPISTLSSSCVFVLISCAILCSNCTNPSSKASSETPANDEIIAKRNDFKVFGWHPYWLGHNSESYDYELLDYISWFTYDISPETGGYTNATAIEELRIEMPNMQAKNTSDKCKYLLTVSSYSAATSRLFLANQADQQNTFIDSISLLAEELELDGITLNFEAISARSSQALNDFIILLSKRLKDSNPDHLLIVTLPAEQQNAIYQFERLDEHVDLFVLASYGFHNKDSATDGPIAPLDAPEPKGSIKQLVELYQAEGLDGQKMLLGLPLYGRVWESGDSTLQSTDRIFKKDMTYRQIRRAYSESLEPRYDALSGSAYYLEQLENGQYEKVWFEDSLSLSLKMEWARNKNLGGAALWALGYNHGHDEIWHAIEKVSQGQDSI